jgi:hypothetical protein
MTLNERPQYRIPHTDPLSDRGLIECALKPLDRTVEVETDKQATIIHTSLRPSFIRKALRDAGLDRELVEVT